MDTAQEAYAWSTLPKEAALDILTAVLELLDERILIVDHESRIRYANQSYRDAYAASFQKIGISMEQLLGQKLSDLTGQQKDVILNVFRTKAGLKKEYFYEKDTDYSGLADVTPLQLGAFQGVVVVQREKQVIESLTEEIGHYKRLAEDLQLQLESKESLPAPFRQIIGSSPAFMKALRMGAQVAPASSSICILGESGTGKEMFAEAIHYSSKYVDGPMVKVNCAAIPESLMESELFGYEKGAFTGANPGGSPGKFELANGGSLFLDEIGEMPPSMQAKLLRALQEKEVTRIGGRKPVKLKFRLITATNRNLEEMVKEGTFREDLFYRICIVPIQLPPLRERRPDIVRLAGEFLAALNMENDTNQYFSEAVLARFCSYRWPGNIRELKNCVERMAILCPDECIDVAFLPPALKSTSPGAPMEKDFSSYNLKNMLEKVEQDAIRSVLSLTKGNKAKAIEILGISKRNFYMKLEKYGTQ